MKLSLLSICLLLLFGCKSNDIQQFTQVLQEAAEASNNQGKSKNWNKKKSQKTASTFVLMSGIRYFNPAEEQQVMRREYEVTSQALFTTLDRAAREAAIKKDIQLMGTAIFNISPTINTIQQTTSLYALEQYNLVNSYSQLAKNHRDVQSFLMANEGKTDAQIAQAIKEFDQSATNADEKIGDKIKAYEKANQTIFNANARLTAAIALQFATVTAALSQDSSLYWRNEGFHVLANLGKIHKASQLMIDRLTVAKNANQMIADDKAVIEITRQIQQKQNERGQ